MLEAVIRIGALRELIIGRRVHAIPSIDTDVTAAFSLYGIEIEGHVNSYRRQGSSYGHWQFRLSEEINHLLVPWLRSQRIWRVRLSAP